MFRKVRLLVPLAYCLSLLPTTPAVAQPSVRDFPPAAIRRLEELPLGRFRSDLERLPAVARERALGWLGGFHFTEHDLDSLRVDLEGGIFYADSFTLAAAPEAVEAEPPIAQAAVPVSPFPESLRFHSKPGAPNVIYLNFTGESVTGTAWNTSLGRTVIPAVAFSRDTDFNTFSDAEQLAIKRVWQRVAEDYAPFNVDVTTERPATFTTRTAHALITRNTDANGAGNPSMEGGGVAYVNVFGSAGYATYRPAWVYYNNLASDESYIAEATSHEIGHNLGLSHDGTSSQSYYGGHGTDDVSWGPLMGTGYDRDVSQWSKGEYYQANNTEDDLALIAAKIAYRTDDIGSTIGTAASLTVSGSGAILATTPENDPSGTNSANKGVIERSNDIDVFSFATGSGTVNLTVNPWIMPSGLTRGGNLDVAVELYNSAGTRLMTNNASNLTLARIQANLSEGIYYLAVRNSGAGSPLSSTPSGYTSYASIGQYFITGMVVASSVVIPPSATLTAPDISQSGVGTQLLVVTYMDNAGIDTSTIGTGDIRVTGPNGFSRLADLVSIDTAANGTPRVATYAVAPASGSQWTPADAGTYSVSIVSNAVYDVEGEPVPQSVVGQFTVSVPRLLYSTSLDTNPGWTLEPQWEFGAPAYTSGSAPTSGATGTNILGFNLSGDYPNRQLMAYATSPAFSCAGAGSLTLRFQRWLRLRSGDMAVVEMSADGGAWTNIWSTSSTIADVSWQSLEYALPALGSSTVRLRFGLESNPSQTDIGWNIDDIQVLAFGSQQSILVSTGSIPVVEGSNASFTIRLSEPPASNLVVTVLRTGGDTDLLITAGLTNVFTPSNWSNAVPVTIFAAVDSDQSAGLSTFECRAQNVSPATVHAVEVDTTPDAQLFVSVNQSSWGRVSTTGGSFPRGTTVPLSAIAEPYFRFVSWAGGLVSTNNPLVLTLETNLSVEAQFAEILTFTHGIPWWWLAALGHTNATISSMEAASELPGANGMPLWQSFVAGLDPNDPESEVRLRLKTDSDGAAVLSWNTVTGRVYTLHYSTNLAAGFAPLPSASGLPSSVGSYTNRAAGLSSGFYRLEVRK